MSSTDTRTVLVAARDVTATEPSDGVWRSAFVSRLKSTRSIFSGATARRRLAVDVDDEIDASRRASGLEQAERRVDEAGDRQLLQLERQRAGVDPGELEEVVDEQR